ncbi:MAG: 4Fe-4S binding protein [Elusimicrobia bacterium]|nr:4Fe-4S binding protein [Elusimicrobiota bacterium]
MTWRRFLQAGSLLLAGVLVLHGFFGPDFAPRNLATLAVWVHTRGLLVLALLAFGNAFCLACPFTLARDLARKLSAPVRRWPRAWRSKAPALLLFALVLFVYERCALWSSPPATAGLILAYFAGAILVDVNFKGAPFCKWLCPLGQFNFAGAALSPFEVAAKDLSVCASCRTKDCLRGRRDEGGNVTLRGCETGLFLPRKVGNMDCTFCMDCVAACPEDNAGLVLRMPGAELVDDRWRSGVGRPSERPDLAALSVVFLFGALLNAYAMTAPAFALAERLSFGLRSETLTLTVMFTVGLVLLPAAVLLGAAALSRGSEPLVKTALRFSPALIPLGLGVWTAHYGFHFLTGAGTLVPAVQAVVEDLSGFEFLGRPLWGLGGLSPMAAQGIGQGVLALGLVGSLAAAWRQGQGLKASWPWLLVCAVLWGAGAWVLSQPMAMRGVAVG